jgi:orotidine-5'-phosphate decarboxylase
VALNWEQARHRLIVALDLSERAAILQLAASLASRVGAVKLGLEAFTGHGPALVSSVQELGLPVFLDLKLHDIPNTVERAAAACARLGVKMFTVHAAGGPAMLAAAVAGAAAGTPAGASPPAVLAVTVLTSLDERVLGRLGIAGSVAERVGAWAEMARECGCGGVVCSAQEAAQLRARLGSEMLLVTPGIRPAGAAVGDQSRVATPLAAVRAGADYLVVGRPITAAADPVAAAEALVAEIQASAR